MAARIERQKALIRKLERGRQDTAHAAFLLQQSLGLKALNEAHRARLQRELESLGCHGSRQPGFPLNALRNAAVLDDGLRLGAEGEAALTVVPSCITSK